MAILVSHIKNFGLGSKIGGNYIKKWPDQIYILKHITLTIMQKKNGRGRGYMKRPVGKMIQKSR